MDQTTCHCKACNDLRAECGNNFTWMQHKLLRKNWPGSTSSAERAYRQAHAPWSGTIGKHFRRNPL